MKRILFLISAVVFTNVAFTNHHNIHQSADYSEAVTAGDYLYVSAQFPIDPNTGKIVEGDMITLTNLVIDNIQHQLHVKGFTLNKVIKTEVYLTDVRNFQLMDSAYAARFNFQYPPARDIIITPHLLNNSPIQISCIAYKNR